MADTKLQIGKLAPTFSVLNDEGKKVKLQDYRGKKVVLYFYPKDNTPGCNVQALGFQENLRAIIKAGAIVLGVSPDSAESHQRFKVKKGLEFTLLVDDDHGVAEAYGVWQLKKFMGKEYMGIVRSHFIIDEKGKLIDAQVKVSPKDSVEKALACLLQ
jgi:thioredoxin-dependent peroxiredoxin